jgi:tRNA A-37 threonylcarbamoyl transferase component Bud32
MSFNPGEQVGPYRIMEQLGQGGMATVYKAYHPALDRYVAIKVLHQAFLEDPNFQARFQREARVVARLEHPNIVPIHDYAEHEKRPYLVMKFIEGETLKARFQSGPLSADEIERIVEKVGAALQYAHKQGILHRDIKPSNVILARDGQIYLADFGLARIAQSGESTLTSDVILGTPQYISPEQALAKRDLDEGTDIYSFGVMIYEMVAGCVPFSADTPFSVIHDHIYTALPLPSSVNPNVSPAVERVLLKALAKDRPDRYADVVSMVQAFKEAWKSQNKLAIGSTKLESRAKAVTVADSVPAKPKPVVGIQKPKRRLRWEWITVGLVILVCLFTTFILLRGRILRLAPIIAATRTAEAVAAVPTSRPISTMARSTATKTPAYPPGILFQSNFDNSQIPIEWNAPSNWSVKDGALCGNGHFFTGAAKGDGWKDYMAKFRLRLDAGSIHLNLRQTSAMGGFNRYFFEVAQNGYTLHKQTGAAFKDNMQNLSASFPLKQWADVELVAQGNRVLMLVNGVIVVDVTDTDNPIGAGSFALETLDSSNACVDDIVVSDLAGKPPVDVLYEQHFDTAASLMGWGTTDERGAPNNDWHVKNGEFCGDGHNWAVLNDLRLTDFAVKYHLTLKGGSIHLNFINPNEGGRYYTWVSIGDSTISLSKDAFGTPPQTLATGRMRILPDQGYDVRFSVVGGRIQFWLNGNRVYDITDKEPLNRETIGFESLDTQYVCIDDLLVTLPSLVQTP